MKSCVTINPCTMCQPLGAVMAFRGVENSMTLLHGSQGCSTYIRLHLCHHFREPLDVASSALNEKEAIYGGEKNLKKALKNVIECYDPALIGVATTCLAETIGDQVSAIVADFKTKHKKNKAHLITVATPSYNGSHIDGFNQTTLALVQYFAKKSQPNQKINIITNSTFSCADIRHLKQICSDFGQQVIVLPDYSDTFEAPLSESFPKVPNGGTTFAELEDTANSAASLSLGADDSPAALYLEDTHQVENHLVNLPIGLNKTDDFFTKIKKLTDLNLPEKYQKQRGRLLDAFVDAHRYTFGVRTAILADPDLAAGLTALAKEIGLKPETADLTSTDFDQIHSWIKEKDIELIIGPSSAAFISEAENIPLIRVGFPIHDRVGAQRKLTLGYDGAIALVDEIANTILEHDLKKPKEVLGNV